MPDTIPLRQIDAAAPARRRRRLMPLAVDAAGLAQLLSCSVRSVRTWDAAGRLPAPIRIGGRVVWRTGEIRAWLRAGAPDREQWAALAQRAQ